MKIRGLARQRPLRLRWQRAREFAFRIVGQRGATVTDEAWRRFAGQCKLPR